MLICLRQCCDLFSVSFLQKISVYIHILCKLCLLRNSHESEPNTRPNIINYFRGNFIITYWVRQSNSKIICTKLQRSQTQIVTWSNSQTVKKGKHSLADCKCRLHSMFAGVLVVMTTFVSVAGVVGVVIQTSVFSFPVFWLVK